MVHRCLDKRVLDLDPDSMAEGRSLEVVQVIDCQAADKRTGVEMDRGLHSEVVGKMFVAIQRIGCLVSRRRASFGPVLGPDSEEAGKRTGAALVADKKIEVVQYQG